MNKITNYDSQNHTKYMREDEENEFNLPSEIVLKILSYLVNDNLRNVNHKNLHCFGLVDKRFYQISLDEKLWEPLLARMFPHIYEQKLLQNPPNSDTFYELYRQTMVSIKGNIRATKSFLLEQIIKFLSTI